MLHGGQQSKFKIDCDALTWLDWDTIAQLIVNVLPNPVEIYGIPTGGERLAKTLKMYAHHDPAGLVWLVDDVLTTGASLMSAAVNIVPARRYGIVLFARGPIEYIPFPVLTVFTLDKQLY